MEKVRKYVKNQGYLRIRGIKVPSKYLLETFEVEDILKEKNSEVQRILVAWYGTEKFLRDAGSQLVTDAEIQNDYEDARIFELNFGGDTFRILELKNQTIEPEAEKLNAKQRKDLGLTEDGYKLYYLVVPSDIEFKSKLDVIGWTFGLAPGEYKPDIEA